MTRQYQIQKITGKPDWNKIEKAPIDQKLWLSCEQISAYAQLAYDDSRLYVHLRIWDRKRGSDADPASGRRKDLACSQRKNAQWLGCDV